jgi:peptidoglycan/xylan/chitin deacetylase (PgdA/CDA1 family)
MPAEPAPFPFILTIHKIRPGGWSDHTNLRPTQVASILTALSDRGYHFADLETVVANPQSNHVAITLDDGYAHLADILPHLCDRFGIRPTVFVPTAFIGKKNAWDYSSIFHSEYHLDSRQMRLLSSCGVEFGSHGHRHRALTKMADDKLNLDLRQSKEILDDITGLPVRSISYPFGRCDHRIVRAALSAGYTSGFGTRWPESDQEKMIVGRCSLYAWDTPFSVLQKAGGRWQKIERAKGAIAGWLSGGTSVFQSIRPTN